MDTITEARTRLEQADDAYEHALSNNASNTTLDQLAQRVADLEHAYYRACDVWEPASGLYPDHGYA